MVEEYKIRPHGNLFSGWSELWMFRELMWMMAWREIRVKYKQAFFGVLWALIQPIAMALVFFLIFRNNPPVENIPIPYYLYVFSGMLLWTFFASSLQNAIQQMIGYAPIIKKIYFPRLYIPLSSFIIAGFDLLLGMGLLLVMLIHNYGISGLAYIQFGGVLFGILVTFFCGFFLSVWLSAWVVKYRDFRYAVTFIIQFLFFITPVFYSSQFSGIRDTGMKLFYEWHPLAMAMDIFRNSLTGMFHFEMKYLSMMAILFVLSLLSVLIFRRTEEYMSDII